VFIHRVPVVLYASYNILLILLVSCAVMNKLNKRLSILSRYKIKAPIQMKRSLLLSVK